MNSLNASPTNAMEDQTPFTYEQGFRFLSRLGSGGFGVVNESQRISDEQIFAVKRTILPEDLSMQDKVLREVVLVKKLDHPHIVKYHNNWIEVSTDNGSDIWKERDSNCPSEEPNGTDSGEDGSESPSNPDIDGSSSGENPHGNGYHEAVTCTLSSGEVSFREPVTRRVESNSAENDSTSAPRNQPYRPERSYLFIVMELCRKIDYKDWLSRNERRPKNLINKFIFQIASALKYIHERCLMHRDLKPGNIFFSEDGMLKVGDFGLAKRFTPTTDLTSPESLDNHSPNMGTPLYQALEQMRPGGRYNNKVDIYALGVIWVESLCPFGTQSERVHVLRALQDRVFPENFAREYPQEYDLLMEMLSDDPIQRPNATDIMDRLLDMYPDLNADQSNLALIN